MTSAMEFVCKLAHEDERKRLTDFNSVKELYEKVSQAFSVPTSEILYCTLNTHNFRDMNSLLGNYLSFGDMIVVHMCGEVKEVTIKKTQEFLGLTITDNANGRAFIKKVKSDDRNLEEQIKSGDHISAINGESTVGLRHYEVAKAIRILPKEINFTMRLIVPRYSDRFVGLTSFERDSNIFPSSYDENNARQCHRDFNSVHRHELSGAISLSSTCDELINSSLPIDKLLSKSSHDDSNSFKLATIEQHDDYKKTIEKINSLLESFLGINDNLLAIRIYRLARENRNSYHDFSTAFKTSDLNVFNFDDDIRDHLWKSALSPSV